MNIFKEFKQFAMRGNVVDMAVGVIIGGAFGKIITSMVNDILMPPIGKLLGNVNFSDLFINLEKHKVLPAGVVINSLAKAKEAGIAVIAYGSFLNTVIDFTIVTFCIFLLIKGINFLHLQPASPAYNTKKCPFCLNVIPLQATRCGHCTSEIK